MTPKLAIIILHKDNNEILFRCLKSIQEKTKFQNYHIYIGDTGSSKDKLQELQIFLKDNFSKTKNVSLITFNYYNFAKNNNEIVKKYIKEENLLVFCNNDIELIEDCLTNAVELYEKEQQNIGTIGFKLLFEDQTIQHAGQLVILTKNQNNNYSIIGNNRLGLSHRGLRQSNSLYNVQENVVGNTGALMVTPKELFLNIQGFNEGYTDCLEDVEYNIQCLLRNKQNVYLPLKAWHFESQTRNNDPQKNQKMHNDAVNFLIPFINKQSNELAKLNLSTLIKQ
jgi:GT2 family glycosyltransferase